MRRITNSKRKLSMPEALLDVWCVCLGNQGIYASIRGWITVLDNSKSP